MSTNDLFKRIQVRAQAAIQNTSTSTSNANDILPKVKDWCAYRYDRIMRSFFWKQLIRDYTISVTSGTSDYALQSDVAKVISIIDETNGAVIEETTNQAHNRFVAPVLEVAGDVQTSKQPSTYRFIGTKSVKALLSAADTVYVVSTATTDISPKVVRIRGLVSGTEVAETITLTGTTNATSTNTYDANSELVISVGTSDGTIDDTDGVISVKETTSGTTLAVLAPEAKTVEYNWIRLSPQPAAALTARVWYKKNWYRLVNDNDIPLIPCANEIVEGVIADALWEDGQSNEAQAKEQKFNLMVTELYRSEGQPSNNLIKQAVPDGGSTRFNGANPLRLFMS